MTTAQFSNSGITIGYDPTVKESIENQLKTMLASTDLTDANIVDYSMLFAAMLLNTKSPFVEVVAGTKSIVIDGSTNLITSSGENEVYDWIRSFSSAGVAFGVGLGVGLVPLPGTTVSGFFLGNSASNWYLNNIFDKWGDVKLYEGVTNDVNDPTKFFVTDSNLENTLDDFWTNSDPEFNLSLLRTQLPKFQLITNGTPVITFSQDKNGTIGFESQPTEDDFREILKNLTVGDLPVVKFGINEHKLLANYYAEGLTLSLIRSDNKALYSVLALKPYILDIVDKYENLEDGIYSDEFLNARLEFATNLFEENLNAYGTHHKDTDANIADYDQYTYGNKNVNVYFGDVSASTTIASQYFGSITGNKNDTIMTSTYNLNDYVEGLDGSDVIHTHDGNDTIYTNANIDTQYDYESSSTVNTVYAGDGADKVYGSAGKDIIYADSDNAANPNQYDNKDLVEGRGSSDKIYGGDGRDTLYADSASSHADTSGDYIVGGLGADVIHGSDGNDTLYGDNETDDASLIFSDKDVIHGYGGSDTIIGGADSDTLIGGLEGGADDGASDHLEGGKGFDTYLVNNGDTIMDSDGNGSVYLSNEHLDGGEKKTIKHIEVTTTNFTKTFIYCECNTVTKWSDVETDEWIEEEEFYVDKATGTKYILNGSSLSVISSSGSITINNFSDGDLGINLSETESIDKKEITKEVFLEEDFCSPLVLDLNGNGINSTRLNESSVYFDMDGDGFKERTAWVENGDGLLVHDKNANGTIDNGSELFGNFTQLADGNNADDGFSALLQHDENRDGKIDKNDAIYNKLNVWVDANQDGITDAGELKTLVEAGVASVNLHPYQSLMSYLDENQDGILNTQDEAFNYVLLREDDNGRVTLFIPQVDNEKAKELFENYKGTDIITTSNGDLLVNGISFANVANIATEGSDVLDGTNTNDKIISLGGNDVLEGKAGSDIIEAGAGDDTLTGGKGNDLLRGEEGNDVYLFERGDGIDTIEDIGGVDRIVFGDGIAHDGIITVIDGNDLVIAVKNGNTAFNDLSDKVIVADWFTQASRIETFEFSDDSLWHVENNRDFNTEREAV